MNKLMMVVGGALCALTTFAAPTEEGFVNLFDGKTFNGWKLNGGSAIYTIEDGVIKGQGVPGTPGNTFLCTEKEYENFILKVEFKFDGGNSGIQFRSSASPDKKLKHGTIVTGYQAEICDNENTAHIYDENRRGYQHGIIWLDNATPAERLAEAHKSYKKGDWNELEIQCVGPSLKTCLNGKRVADVFDDCQFKGFIGLQIHCQRAGDKAGVAYWRNIRIKELPPCEPWKEFFVKDCKGEWKLNGARFVIPQDWKFVTENGETYLRGIHDEKERKDGLVISDADYDNFIARVTYQLNGGNSALYFRAAEENVPWVLKGFQNEIAGNEKDSALWHTQGEKTPGRGWVARNDELVKKVRKTTGWNTTATIAIGDRIVNRLNGFETFDIIDPKCEKTGKLGLQLHGGCKNEMRFMKWEMMPIPAWMLDYIKR